MIMEKNTNSSNVLEKNIIKTIETLRQLQIMLDNYENDKDETWKYQM
jgi:hypothetical protein